MASNDDFMRRAIALAAEAIAARGGGPFGAVIVRDGRIIAEGANRVTSANDPTAHAEIVAIRAACQALGAFSLAGAEIFSSCEPCPMCLAAIYWARLDRLWFANTRADAAALPPHLALRPQPRGGSAPARARRAHRSGRTAEVAVTLWLALVLAGIATLSGTSAWRSHRELRAWLGRDELAARRSLRVLLFVSASLLIAFAWMRLAQTPARFTGAGSDVVLLIDVSRSMDTRDTPPSRLRRATRVAERLVQHVSGTRIALVLFAGDAFAAVPLTHDRDALETYLHTLDSELISRPGSDLARALRVAADVFDPRSDRSRALVLLSDGEHAGGDLDAALSYVRRLGVRVVTVGFGTQIGRAHV